MDQIYISRVVAGDTNAFRHLVDKYKDAMLAAAFRIIKDKDLAEDVLQEAFLSAYKNLKGFKGEAKFSTWLYKIVVNNAIQKIRKGEHLKQNYETESIDSGAYELNDSLMGIKAQEQSYYIDKTLQSMMAREALVLQLFYLNELSLKEVADILNLKIDHVKVLLHRARKQFYSILANELKHEVKSLI